MVWLSTTTCTPIYIVSPRGGLGPRCCATCASASGDFPPWQSRRTLTGFSTSLQNNTCGRSKDASTEVCPIGAHCGRCPWLCYGSGAAPSRPRRTMRNAKRIHTCLQNCPPMCCTPTPNFFLLLDAASKMPQRDRLHRGGNARHGAVDLRLRIDVVPLADLDLVQLPAKKRMPCTAISMTARSDLGPERERKVGWKGQVGGGWPGPPRGRRRRGPGQHPPPTTPPTQPPPSPPTTPGPRWGSPSWTNPQQRPGPIGGGWGPGAWCWAGGGGAGGRGSTS